MLDKFCVFKNTFKLLSIEQINVSLIDEHQKAIMIRFIRHTIYIQFLFYLKYFILEFTLSMSVTPTPCGKIYNNKFILAKSR